MRLNIKQVRESWFSFLFFSFLFCADITSNFQKQRIVHIKKDRWVLLHSFHRNLCWFKNKLSSPNSLQLKFTGKYIHEKLQSAVPPHLFLTQSRYHSLWVRRISEWGGRISYFSGIGCSTESVLELSKYYIEMFLLSVCSWISNK